MGYLFDTSAILNIIKNRRGEAIKILKGNYTLKLARYEIGNAIWKDIALLKTHSFKTGLKILATINKLLEYLNIVNPTNLEDVLTIATGLQITFYDAAYISVALEKELTFITDDKKLYKKITENKNFLKQKFLKELYTANSASIE